VRAATSFIFIAFSPGLYCDLLFGNADEDTTDYFEKEQADQVLAVAHQCSQCDYLILRVLWRTGVRVNELLIRHVARDIEPQNSVIYVIKAKGGKQRRVAFRHRDDRNALRIRFGTTTR